MLIRRAGKLRETLEDIRNTLAKFQDKILQIKVLQTIMHDFLAKYWQNLHIHTKSILIYVISSITWMHPKVAQGFIWRC